MTDIRAVRNFRKSNPVAFRLCSAGLVLDIVNWGGEGDTIYDEALPLREEISC